MSFTKTKLVICEGPEDAAFLQLLLRDRAISGFDVLPANGNGNFRQAMNALRTNSRSYFNKLTDIVIVADNDDSPSARFNAVCDQIRAQFDAAAVPQAPWQTSKRTATRQQAISVVMIPDITSEGHLEALCQLATYDADRKVGAAVNHFLDSLHADKWSSASRRAKAWLRVNLAMRCERDPFVPLGHVFGETKHHHLIPVAHPSFDGLANFLKAL